MRWEDERYVRIYTRDTPDWLAMQWQGRAVFYELARKVDRAGFVPTGKSGTRGIAGLLHMPIEIVEVGIKELIEDGCLVRVDGGLLIRNFLDAQETPQSDKARKRAQRERDRDMKRASADDVTARDQAGQSVTNRDSESQNVTERHDVSRGDTQRPDPSLCTVPCRTVPNQEDPPYPPQAGEPPAEQTEHQTDPLPKAKRSRKTTTATLPGVGSEPADDIFAVFLDAWQKTIGIGAAPVLDEKRRKLVRARLGEGYTVERLKAAARGIFESRWHIDEKRCSFDLAMRDAAHVEQFAGYADDAKPAAPIEKPAWLTQLPPRPRFFLRQCEDAAREQNALRGETTTQQTGTADPFAGLEDGMAEVPS